MIDWVAVREAIRQAVAVAAGISPESVAWAGQSEAGSWQAFPYIEIRTKRRKAWDDSVIYSTGPAGDMVTEVQGPRELGLEIRIVGNNQDENQALCEIAELLQTRMGFAAARSILEPVEAALGTWGPTIEADFYNETGRKLTAAIVEVSVNLAQNITDTTAETDYIETVTYQADKITLPDGSNSPLQPLVTVTKP